MARCAFAIVAAALCVVPHTRSQTVPGTEVFDRAALAREVKHEYLRAWEGYRRAAWGYDEVQSVSGKPRNWYRESMLVTPIDALDGLMLLGIRAEAESLCSYLAAGAVWDRDVEVQCFEITIRCVGGLVASYELTGDRRLLKSAEDLARRMLPAFATPTGMPMRWVARSRKAGDPVPTYDVFDASGNQADQITLGPRSRVVGFGKGTVYVARSDEHDLQYLERYRR